MYKFELNQLIYYFSTGEKYDASRFYLRYPYAHYYFGDVLYNNADVIIDKTVNKIIKSKITMEEFADAYFN